MTVIVTGATSSWFPPLPPRLHKFPPIAIVPPHSLPGNSRNNLRGNYRQHPKPFFRNFLGFLCASPLRIKILINQSRLRPSLPQVLRSRGSPRCYPYPHQLPRKCEKHPATAVAVNIQGLYSLKSFPRLCAPRPSKLIPTRQCES